MSCHTVLQIQRGIPKIPGDTTSLEQGVQSINLLDPIGGFSLDIWTPQYAALKGSAIYADTPLDPGRLFITGQDGHVIEKFEVTLSAPDMQTLGIKLSHLMAFRQHILDFWRGSVIEPVYLVQRQTGEPGLRYALISNLDVALKEEPIEDSGRYLRDFSLTIEREPYWRGEVPPGGNPKRWAAAASSSAFSASKADLTAAPYNLVSASITNVRELNAAATALATRNYIEIPAASIPGDAPALCSIHITQTATSGAVPTRTFIGKTTKPDVVTRAGATRFVPYTLNAGDSAVSPSDASLVADTGAPNSTSPLARTRGRVTFATVTAMASRFYWDNTAANRQPVDFTTLRGRFLIYSRVRLSAAGTVNLKLRVIDGGAEESTTPVSLTDQGAGGTGNTTQWGVVQLGTMTFPIENHRAIINTDGLGIGIPAAAAGNMIELHAERASGTPELYVSDIIFIPIDEGAIYTLDSGIYDTTGYSTHGVPEAYAQGEFSGVDLTLTPGVTNRLVFFTFAHATMRSHITDAYTINVNIVPRWIGLRDR